MAEPEIAALQLYKPIERYHAKRIDSSIYGNMRTVCVVIGFTCFFDIINPGDIWGRYLYWNVGSVKDRFVSILMEPFEAVWFRKKEVLQLNGGVLHEKAAALGGIEVLAAGY